MTNSARPSKPRPAPAYTIGVWRIFFASALLGALGITILASFRTAPPFIHQDISASDEWIIWVIGIFMLVAAAIGALLGRAAAAFAGRMNYVHAQLQKKFQEQLGSLLLEHRLRLLPDTPHGLGLDRRIATEDLTVEGPNRSIVYVWVYPNTERGDWTVVREHVLASMPPVSIEL